MNSVPLLSTAYLAPVEYFSFLLEEEVQVEYCEHFVKQSFRNRMVVMTANGPQVLTIPIVRGSASKMMIADTRIDYKTPWQRNHWKTIESAYGNSPFFLYYQDPIRDFYEQTIDRLIDFNLQLTQTILKMMKVNTKISLTEDFMPMQTFDLRSEIHPKKQQDEQYAFRLKETYSQVFDEKYGFVPNLSILDLLFNLGPEARGYLMRNLNGYKETL